jgi:hypothetical protein
MDGRGRPVGLPNDDFAFGDGVVFVMACRSSDTAVEEFPNGDDVAGSELGR